MDNLFLLIFIAFIIGVLMFDLLCVGRGHHVVSIKEASVWTVVWVTLALGFFLFLRFDGHLVHGIDSFDELLHVTQKYGLSFKYDGLPLEQAMANGLTIESAISQYQHSMSIDFLSGYLIEETLSIDNLFVMLMLLTGFGVRKKDYKSVLFWGIMGAIVLRFTFIFLGSTLIQKFNWILLVFGVYLAYMGVKMFFKKEEDNTNADPRDHKLVKFLSKHFSVYPRYVNGRFFIRDHRHKLFITPLLIVVITIEFTDLIFAFDSIPAIFSVTCDPYVVFFSNIFAIIGLRSLFFMLSGAVDKFCYLKQGVAVLLLFVGAKLLFHHWLDEIGFSSVHSLYVILGIITLSIVLSLLFPKKEAEVRS
ncbi:MAG: TerC/Alx family metal homeostasis membrane protein [Salinivirgaceae bacterium]|nr:TerC/Alx family metal homeostasis membrane protein [Salinivirgaceae bacterium]